MWQFAFYDKCSTFPSKLVRTGQVRTGPIERNGNTISKFKMAAAANSKSDKCAFSIWLLRSLADSKKSHRIQRGLVQEMATHFLNSRWWRPPSFILINMHFSFESCVLCQILNIPIKFGEDWSDSREMATHFRNSRLWLPPSPILINMRFWSDGGVPCQNLIILVEFCGDWSNSKDVAIDFRSSSWRRPPSWVLVNVHFPVYSCFNGKFSTFP